ncbi:MAG: D-tyrosyl-tRNA(Tyr) deacylase [Gemmatimonadota bacterium]|nr:MAG: D-tyrosyl-tRNA(Tyr) deacylase [Gemmatimonadota bacterium]
MRVVVQRVSRASVAVSGRIVGSIQRGFLLFVGFEPGDDDAVISWMADKVVGLRVFSDEEGRMNLDLRDVDGAVLVVSQFTLYGDARKGRRPSFVGAAPPEEAAVNYERFVTALKRRDVPVATGEFGAVMQVDAVNDGPVTLILDR